MFIHAMTIPESMIQKLNISDEYSLHRVVYSQFPLTRTPEQLMHTPSGIQWKELQNSNNSKNILIVSDREIVPKSGLIIKSREIPESYFSRPKYRFEITANPTTQNNNKRKAIVDRTEIIEWFKRLTKDSGFDLIDVNVDLIKTSKFKKNGAFMKLVKADISGMLSITDKEKFKNTFSKGVGRSRTLGCGLLQITPIA